ncbi:hypothetical protein PYCCODRAFT_1459015 [Trametes coccinea BRFM310]|uniref:BZIP domain-containing protein n=1 Tax=Trametes coccinea (strain BRFM310) TaxID=1353009 RepID=A0A1Y2INC1_TRAC3|nr:hypothetical protein PYCCODRAFT_1459015 [Trametes coccinea BRFM310]
MLVDNPVQHNFTSYQPSFEDFFNMDLLAGSSNNGTGSSGSSPHSSPSNSFVPLTPPEVRPLDDFSYPSESFFSFAQEDEQSKLSAFAVPPATAPGYDFLSLSQIQSLSSPESSGSGSNSGNTSEGVDSPVGIDPQLVGTPAPSKAASEFDEEEEGEDDEAKDEDMQSIPEDLVIAPVKVGGKGKSNRKGTVRDGGIVKRTAGVEKKENAKPSGHSSVGSVEPDDWRPSPEEYKKMSSKEKRQLRNKISARNFRIRRKEYIATLEGDIAERDRLIDAIRTELGSTKNENVALRQEIAQLKKALLEGRGRADTPVLPPPAPLPTVPASVLASSSSSPSPPPAHPRSPLLTPNTQKDLPTSPRMGARAFWGGAHGMGGFGSITPVHTTLVPDLSSVLSGKPVADRKPVLQENINPTLNGSPASLASILNSKNEDKSKEHQQLPMGAFDAFADINPFTLKSMDAYRMHLWGRMAQQQAAHRHSSPGQQQQASQSPSGLASNLRPHYFAKNPSLTALLSGKSASTSASHINPYPTPPNSPPLAHSTLSSSSAHNQQRDTPTAQQAMLASIASQTLLGKLGSAFWDAFARPSGSLGPNGHSKREWDADKVRRVMEGTAVVRIVDVEPRSAPSAPSPRSSPVQEKNERPQAGPSNATCAACVSSVTDILAESMATLNLGRK